MTSTKQSQGAKSSTDNHEETSKTFCMHCGKPSTEICSNCNKVVCGSSPCRFIKSGKHKDFCVPVYGEKSTGLRYGGQKYNYWVTTRDIEEGETIYIEHPIITGPYWCNKFVDKEVCIGCHFKLNKPAPRCSHCNWPLCASYCPGAHTHKLECSVLQEADSYDEIVKHLGGEMAYGIIRFIRLLFLREYHPNQWTQVVSLHTPNRAGTTDPSETLEKYCSVNIFTGLQRRLHRFSPLLVHRMLKVELFHSKLPIETDDQKAEMCLYAMEAGIDASCISNVLAIHIPPRYTRNLRRNGYRLIAVTKLKAGSRLYGRVLKDNGIGTRARQLSMCTGKICCCALCSDPTELDTFYSAIKCLQCFTGYLLPVNPLDLQANWKCNLDLCSNEISASDIDKIVEDISTQCQTLESQLNVCDIDMSPQTIQTYNLAQKFIDTCSKELLHPNHYLLRNIRDHVLRGYALALEYTHGIEDIPLDMFDNVYRSEVKLDIIVRYCALAKQAFQVAEKLFPGLTIQMAKEIYLLASGKYFTAHQQIRSLTKFEQTLKLLKEARVLRLQVKSIMKTIRPYDNGREKWSTGLQMFENRAINLCLNSGIHTSILPELGF